MNFVNSTCFRSSRVCSVAVSASAFDGSSGSRIVDELLGSDPGVAAIQIASNWSSRSKSFWAVGM